MARLDEVKKLQKIAGIMKENQGSKEISVNLLGGRSWTLEYRCGSEPTIQDLLDAGEMLSKVFAQISPKIDASLRGKATVYTKDDEEIYYGLGFTCNLEPGEVENVLSKSFGMNVNIHSGF
jgi:hypothetical protein